MFSRDRNSKVILPGFMVIFYLTMQIVIESSISANVPLKQAFFNEKLNKAVILFKQKQYEKVKRALLPDASKNFSNDVWQETLYEAMILNLKSKAYCIKAKIALDKKDLKEANSYYKECKRLSPHASHLSGIEKDLSKLIQKQKSKGELNPANAKKVKVLSKKAKKKEAKENWESALVYWNKILILNPENKQARKNKTKCIVEISNRAKKKEAKKFWKQGMALYYKKKYVASKFLFEQHLSHFPKDKKAKKIIQDIDKTLELISEKAQQLILAKSSYLSAIDYKKNREYKKALELLQEGKGLSPKYKNWDSEIASVQKLEQLKFLKSRQHKIDVMNRESRKGVAALLAEKLNLAVNHLSIALKLAIELEDKEDSDYNKQYLKMAKDGLERKNKEEVNVNNPFYTLVQKLIKSGDEKYKVSNYKEAYNHYEGVRILFPENRLAKQKIILCDLKIHPEGAKNQIDAILDFGKELMKKKDYRGAKSNFLVVKKVSPNYPHINKLLRNVSTALKGRVLHKKISKTEANKRYKSALKIYKQKPAQALKMLNSLLKLYANHSNALNLKNRLQHILVRKKAGNSIAAISPKAIRFFTKGLRYYTNGNLFAAKKAFENSLKVSPKYNKARRALKRVKRQLKG